MADTIGTRLRRARDAAALSRRQVAQALDCTEDAVMRWERGDTSPSAERLVALARVLDADAAWLLTGHRT